jgi:DNA-binding IclR family transcriptional regulator
MTAGSGAQVLLAWEPPEAVMPLLPVASSPGARWPRCAGAAGRRASPSASPASQAFPRPIRDRTGRVIAAISVSGPIERLGRRPGDRHAMAVVRAGQRLSGL